MHDQATDEVRKGHGWPEANLPPGSRRTFAARVFRRDHLPLEPLQPALRIPLKLADLGAFDRSAKKPIGGLGGWHPQFESEGASVRDTIGVPTEQRASAIDQIRLSRCARAYRFSGLLPSSKKAPGTPSRSDPASSSISTLGRTQCSLVGRDAPGVCFADRLNFCLRDALSADPVCGVRETERIDQRAHGPPLDAADLGRMCHVYSKTLFWLLPEQRLVRAKGIGF